MQNDNLPIEVLEAYDTIEKLLSPGDRIVEANKTASDCLLMILNKLYKHQVVPVIGKESIKLTILPSVSDIEKLEKEFIMHLKKVNATPGYKHGFHASDVWTWLKDKAK